MKAILSHNTSKFIFEYVHVHLIVDFHDMGSGHSSVMLLCLLASVPRSVEFAQPHLACIMTSALELITPGVNPHRYKHSINMSRVGLTEAGSHSLAGRSWSELRSRLPIFLLEHGS